MANCDSQATLANIATWLRHGNKDEICPWWADGGDCVHCSLGFGGQNCIFEKIADCVDAAAERELGSLDALERACEKVLDAETLKAVVAEKQRIQGGGAA